MDKNWLVTRMREGTDPHNKPKIYISFCDRAQIGFLDSVAEEILSFMDCVIYYRSGVADEAERKGVIQGVNIMVALITRDAVNEESIVYKEMAFATVPVLPIVVERIKPEDINATFNKRQYLYREAVYDDNASIFDYGKNTKSEYRYKMKLKDYLEETLINKELYEAIRKEFSGKIFLSYRKKDYRWISNIGNIIMKDERFRDTSIWFDDYLIYGENFDETIKNAIIECDTFVLAITHNMVNEDNYVISVEYPLAKKLNKNILPIIIEDVDKEIIEEKFPGIGDAIKLEKHKEIPEKLVKMLKGYSDIKLDNSPGHLRLIGLAHYFGVSVPKRSNEGFAIIKEAADKGSVDAIQMVAGIYRDKGDFREAVLWQEKAVVATERFHYDNERLFKEKLKLAELYRLHNAEAEFAKILRELVSKFKEMLVQRGIYEGFLLELGKFLAKSGDFKESKTYFNAVIKAYKDENSKPYELAEVYRLLANIYIDEHEFSRAAKLLEKANTIFKERDGKNISEERIRVSVDFEKLRETAIKADVHVEIKNEYISVCELEAQVKKMKMSDACRTYKLLGECKMSVLPESAADYFKKALANLSKYEYLNNEAYKEKVAELCLLIAGAYERAGNYREAESYYRKACDCYIIEGENAVRYCDGYINCRNKLARLYYKMEYYQKSYETFEFPTRGYSSVNLDKAKAHVIEDIKLYITRGCCCEALEDYFRAEEIYRLAAKTIREAMQKFSSAGLKELLVEVYARLGTIYGEREDCDSYHTYFKRAIKLYKRDKFRRLSDEGEAAYRHYADALLKDSKKLRAWRLYRKAMKFNIFSVDKMIRGTVIYSKSAGLFADMKMLSLANRYLKKAEKLWDNFTEYEKRDRKSGKFPFEVPPTYYRKGLREQSPRDELKKAREHIEA